MSGNVFEKRWFMCDYARQRVFVREEFLLWLDALKRLGYNGIGMYLEGAFDFDTIPGVIREGVMTKEDAAWAIEEGAKRGIRVFPMTNVVGHMEHFFRQERFHELVMKDTDERQMNFLDERAEAFAMQIVHEFTRAFPVGLVHIGGDEVKLTPETKHEYAKFLAKICANLLEEGITPAIWADMIWMDQDLCQYFDRRTVIFDWNYYGHRPESPVFFRDLGFTDVLVCPCDNSWEGFIGYQHTSNHLRARQDMPVLSYEVEAFLNDGKEAGVTGGLLTNWNNETGRNMWGQWMLFARAGLYMSGKLERTERNDALIEEALFGRETPYTAVTHFLQEEVPYQHWHRFMRNSMFLHTMIPDLLKAADTQNTDAADGYAAAANKAEKMLDAWIPEGEFETRCCEAMHAVCSMIRGGTAMLNAMKQHALYRRAAEIQFDSPEIAAQMLERVAGAFRTAALEVRQYAQVHAHAIRKLGHSQNDLIRLGETVEIMNTLADRIETAVKTVDRIPLCRFDLLIRNMLERRNLF